MGCSVSKGRKLREASETGAVSRGEQARIDLARKTGLMLGGSMADRIEEQKRDIENWSPKPMFPLP